MRNIIASLYKNPIVHTVDIIDIIEEPEIQLLYAKVTLIDKTLAGKDRCYTLCSYRNAIKHSLGGLSGKSN